MALLRRFSACLALVIALAIPVHADSHPEWTAPAPPFQIGDNLYYVGSRDLASYLITTKAGNILINQNLDVSPPLLRSSVEKLGFRWADIKILLNSQAHFDHVGGLATVQRETHARVMAMDGDADVIESGGRTDFAFGPKQQFAPVHVDRILHDGDTVELGGVTLIAHKTAGHTRGCTTWTMRVHVPGEPSPKLRSVVIVGGFEPLPSYRLIASKRTSSSYPGIADDAAATYRTLHQLPCDIFLGAHGVYFGLLGKLARLAQKGPAVWIDPAGYQAAVADAQHNFERELAKQRDAVAR